MCCSVPVGKTAEPPKWIKPQLSRVVDEAPAGNDWLHEVKYDGYRMHARLDRGKIQLLTRTGLDWSRRYPRTIEALRSLPGKTAYLDGELCALRPDGVPAFSRLQAAMDEGRTDDLVFIVFDLLYLNGKITAELPLIKRKELLQPLLAGKIRGLRFSDHIVGNSRRFHEEACRLGVEGVISKRIDRPYAPGNRGLWLKVKCLNREEFVVVGWTDPEGSRPWLGALLLGYYDPAGRLIYAGRAGTGINHAELERLWRRLQPLATSDMPLDVPPPLDARFGSALTLSRMHWVRPELVAEVKFLSWTEDNLLRQVVYEGLREDKPAADVRRAPTYPKPPEPARTAPRSQRSRSG